ncbi:hypothetical protein FOA43_004380 [Brettanomyces nanus]|uniref:Importin N-terminal domain-containing protein n=1 Tax=Eeniella nana TaxID=13502 RepID=A0A875S6M2_EENNA|nr:uncharacterized protein FOA43_004380 [Brettanomyces nanus]QPG76986.1 hypothetical protein FOA43_004380 [Brettanomyces nanus]
MNVGTLHQCFLGTLQADSGIRTNAEEGLKEAAKTQGFLAACLDILDSSDVELPVKKACLIYFKNVIIRNWESGKNIDNDEKPIVRDRLVTTIVHSERSMKSIFVPVLNEVLVADYPQQWPSFLPTAVSLMSNSNDLDSLYTGILCFSELCRKYRWMKNPDRSAELDPIIVQYFPSLLHIGKQLVSDPAAHDSHWEVGEIVKLIMKCYKFVTYMDMPLPLQENNTDAGWITFHVETMNMNLPPSAMKMDEDERYLNPWVKAQKWAYANIFNIYVRFGSKGWLASSTYDKFRTFFSGNVVPGLLKVYFEKIQEWRQQGRWISDACFYQIISFIEHAVTKKSAWQLIRPYMNTLITDLAFPLLCPRDSTLDLFENDPQEYILMTFAIEETKNSPITAARNMISTLVEKRKEVALQPVLQFAYEKLSSLATAPDVLETAKQKESALRLIDAISRQLVEDESPVKSQLEEFLATSVFPNFKSQYGFLRARTCDVSSKFDKVDFTQPQNLSILFQGVINCFNEVDHIPVQFEAAMAIQAFIDFPQFKEALGLIIVATTEKLLTLSNEIDSDVIPAVIQSCVENYSEQLEPFGVNLMCKLTEQLMRILSELNDAQNSNVDDYDTDELGTKTNAALGLFSTVITVLLYFENSAEKISNLEQIYAPMIQYVLRNDLDSFFAEAFEMIENTTFLTRSVSPIMWSLFEDSMTALMNSDLSLNLEDAVSALKNYLMYGGTTFKENKQYEQAIMQMVMKVFTTEGDFAADDMLNAAEIATYFVLALNADTAGPFVPHLVKEALRLISSDDVEHSSNIFKTILANVIIASMVIDPNDCIQTLFEQNAFDQFFNLWTKLCAGYKRVFDLKLSILALISFLNIDSKSLTQMDLGKFVPQSGINLAVLLTEIPQAISDLEKKRKEFNSEEAKFNDSTFIPAGIHDDDDDDDWEDENEEENLDDLTGESELVMDSDYLDQFGFSTEEGLDDDPYVNTPLDNLNVFKTFKDFMFTTQSGDTEKYSQILSVLTTNQQHTLSNIVQIASD